MHRNILPAVAVLICAVAAYAQPPQEAPKPAAAPPAKDDRKPPEEKVSQTKHTIRIGGKDVKYTATAGTMLLKKEDGTATASFFYVAYIKDDVPDATKRPLTFAFNGGPGSSSVWLQLGALGPKRVMMDPEGNALPPPYKLVDNEYSILDLTDLVFIDPVSTGAARFLNRTPRTFTGFRATWSRWPISSGYTPRAAAAGRRPNSWQARVTALRARRIFPAICSNIWATH
jgi:carboxypeptidase C (cathepsin A)